VLLFTAVFDNNDAALQLGPGTQIRAEVIVSFGNAPAKGNSTTDVDINGNGTIDADEARVRSVASRLTLTVPNAIDASGSVALTDTIDDISATGDVTFSNVVFSLGATGGTVTADVTGGTRGGSITNCARLKSADQTVGVGGYSFAVADGVDLQACSAVDVSGTPPNCTPGAPGCGWRTGDMRTFPQGAYGDATSHGGTLLAANFGAQYGANSLLVGGAQTLRFTTASAVISYLPASGVPAALTGSLTNPLTSSSGEFGGQIVALQINADFSGAGVIAGARDLGSLYICSYAASPLVNGQTVDQFLVTANSLLGGGSASFGIGTANAVAAQINNAFVDGVPSTFAQENLVAGPCPANWSVGQMRTATQDGWDTGTAATLLATSFSSTYGAGVVIGGTFTTAFTNASAVFAYLPALGSPAAFNASLINPITTSAGSLGGQILALQLNSDFSALFNNDVSFGDLRICGFTTVPASSTMHSSTARRVPSRRQTSSRARGVVGRRATWKRTRRLPGVTAPAPLERP
jgi:hypothetical protein